MCMPVTHHHATQQRNTPPPPPTQHTKYYGPVYTGMRPWQNWLIIISSLAIAGSFYKWGYHPERVERATEERRMKDMLKTGARSPSEYEDLRRKEAEKASRAERPKIEPPSMPGNITLPKAPKIHFYPPSQEPKSENESEKP